MTRALLEIRRIVRDERGQDLLEYAMLTALIAVAAIVGVVATGTSIGGTLWGAVSAGAAAAF